MFGCGISIGIYHDLSMIEGSAMSMSERAAMSKLNAVEFGTCTRATGTVLEPL